MAKRLTPIERAIRGEANDRRRRYDASLPSKGLTRLTMVVPTADVERVKGIVRELRAARASDAGIGDGND